MDSPIIVLALAMCISVFLLGFALRVYERPFSDDNRSENQDFGYIWNSLWLIMLAMTTVGYGDFAPRTHIGRAITTLACLWGVFIISLIVVSLTNTTAFTKSQARAHSILTKIVYKEKQKILAAIAIQNFFKYIRNPKHRQVLE